MLKLNPNFIVEGQTYQVLFGEQTKTVFVSGRTGNCSENYVWYGTLVDTAVRVRIRNAERFVREVTAEQFGSPWFISLDIVGKSFKNDKMQMLRLSIRETGNDLSVGYLPEIPIEVTSSCAEVIRNAIRFCRSGPRGADTDKIHLFDDEGNIPLDVSVDLSFDMWDPTFASEGYFEALLGKIEAAWLSIKKAGGIRNSFQPNIEGVGAVYWTEKTGVVKVLWVDSFELKSLYLQSEKDISDFAEGLFGCHGHSFEALRQLLDSYEGEWFDPPENFALYSSYRVKRFSSLRLGHFPLIYESDDTQGAEYYGRVVVCEEKSTCPEIMKWNAIENKFWLRTNAGEDVDYEGPFENCSQAAREMYLHFFGVDADL